MNRRRLIRRLLGALAALALAPLLAALWLGASQGGLRTLLHWAAPAVSAEVARGSLLGGAVLDNLRIQGGGVRLAAERLTIRWRPAELLAGRLHLTEVSARGVTAGWRDDGVADGGGAPPPVALAVDRLTVDGLQLEAEGERFTLERLELTAHGDPRRITLSRWSLQAGALAVSGEGALAPSPAPRIDQRLRWVYAPPGRPAWSGDAGLSGDPARLELALAGKAPQPFDARLTVEGPAAPAPRWRATLAAERIDPSRLDPRWPALPVRLAAELHGDLEQARIDTLSLQREGGGQLTLEGRVDAPWGGPRFALNGGWTDLGWPLEPPTAYRSDRGTFTLAGRPDDYRLTLAGDLRGDRLPPGEWRLNGEGDPREVRFPRVEGEWLGGRVTGDATLGWAPRLHWRARLGGEGLDPGRAWPRWDGRLSTAIDAEGDDQRLTLRLERLTGTLRGQPLQAGGVLRREGEALTLDHGLLTAADNRLALAGRLAPRPDLSWSVEAPRLEALLPDAAGALRGAGRLAGDLTRPRLTGTLGGERLRYLDHRADRLTLEAALEPGERRPSRLHLTLTGLASPLLPFRTLRVEGDGPPDRHRLELRADGEAEARITLQGGFDEGGWSGRIEASSWDHPDTGRWRQEAPAALTLGADVQRLAPLCLRGAGRLCLEGRRAAGDDGRLAARLTDLPARLPLKPLAIQADATLDGRLTLDATGDGELLLQATPGVLRHHQPNLPEVVVQHGAGRLRARLDHHRLHAEGGLGLGELGEIRGELTVAPPGGDAERPLDGALTLALARLDWLTALLPQLAAVDGELDARLKLGGSVERPRLSGLARLEATAAELPEQGIRLTGVRLRAEGDGAGPLCLVGEAGSGEGRLQLAGTLRPGDPWEGELTLTGSGFEAIDTAEARVVLDPALRLHYRPGVIRVDGRLVIPEARITPAALEGAVTASRDVEIVGKPARRGGPRIDSDLTIELGERVRFAAAGFDGGLQGRVRWWELDDQPPRAEGELTTREAEYRLYGQRLAVEHGRLRFTGGPADNPELDLTATRRSGEVTAGARVRGTLREPRLALFSEPPMNQSDTLSYLLFGRPGDRLSGSEGELLLSAASGLFSGGGDGPIHAIGQRLGLDEARIRSDEGLQGSALVLGKYLSPRLYLGYAAGLFEPSGSVELRYRLSDRWEIKSESGTAGSGADLLFTLEK